jgi:ATP-dependent Clp protease ATP-binding subunit ClpC
MFERYTQSARRVIFNAREEAMRRGSPYIESEHLLLGVLRENESVATRLGGTIEAVADFHQKIQNVRTVGQLLTGPVEVPLSTDAKRILILAAEEAGTMDHKKICVGHFLLSMLRIDKSAAAEILLSGGATIPGLRENAIRDMRWADAPD